MLINILLKKLEVDDKSVVEKRRLPDLAILAERDYLRVKLALRLPDVNECFVSLRLRLVWDRTKG